MTNWDELTIEQKVAYVKGALDLWDLTAAPQLGALSEQVFQLTRRVEDLEKKRGSTMCKFIADALDVVRKGGFTPTRIRLGANRLKEFRDCLAQYTKGPVTVGPREAYDDIPIVKDLTSDNRLAIEHEDDLSIID